MNLYAPQTDFSFKVKALDIVFHHPDSSSTSAAIPVRSNYYGQNKFASLRKLGAKIEKLGKIIKTLDWQDGYSVHKDGASHYVISDIKSIYRNPASPYNFISSNEDGTKYWEEGFFNSQDPSEKSKYFMMVNRRCIPEVNYDGDIRQLKIKFDSAQLAGFKNWKITELDSNRIIRTFDKDSNIYVNVGMFQPGEGKLFKLAPVMQEGGTLVANEQVEGISFVCSAPVINNGKDIKILNGTKIEFKTGAGIIMNGGKLTCSNNSTKFGK